MIQNSISGLALLGLSFIMSVAVALNGGQPVVGECSICEIKEPVAMEVKCVHGKGCAVMIIPDPAKKKKKKKTKEG